jgi:hypothetical protein
VDLVDKEDGLLFFCRVERLCFFDAFALSLAVIRVTFVADLDFFDVATLASPTN